MINQKLENLKLYLEELGSVAVAFSSGVDSTFLLDVAHEVLGEKAIAVTVTSDFFTDREENEAVEFCQARGIKHTVWEFHPLALSGIASNPPDRCYLCKKALFTNIEQLAAEQGVFNVLDGSNIDDLSDYRPGMKALEELEIKSPLREAGLTKSEIRELSRVRGLNTWDKPAFACLASRVPYGEQLTRDKLNMIQAGEEYLKTLGLKQFRVRVHDNLARIEVEPDAIIDVASKAILISDTLKKLGFTYVTLDLGGYRMGSMNEVLEDV